MKRFSLNTKRAAKVLALTLAAAMVVPNVPVQKASAETTPQPGNVPEAVKVLDFNSMSGLIADDAAVKGKRLKFTNELATKEFVKVSSDGITPIGTFQSLDKVPEMNGEEYVYEDVNVAPTIVRGDEAVRGGSLRLKGTVEAVKYPSAAPDQASTIQSQKAYYSGVKTENPFAKYRDELYDASRFSLENIADTATEVERQIVTYNPTAAVGTVAKAAMTPSQLPNDYTATKNAIEIRPEYEEELVKSRNRYSAPEAKTGVTVSFWAQVPYDEKAEGAAKTNFFEFANTDSLIYKSDDLSKVYMADLYKKAVDAGTADDQASPFYSGTVVTGKAVAVHSKFAAQFEAQTGAPFDKNNNNEFKYVKNIGKFAHYNPNLADNEAAIEKSEGQYVVWTVNSVTPWNNAGSGEIVIDPGITDKMGNALYYHLKPTNASKSDIEQSDYPKYVPTDENPMGKNTIMVQGATGWLYMATDQVNYMRDNKAAFKTGIDINKNSSTYGTIQNAQANANASITNAKVAEIAEDEEWHYYTVTITDEWFQVYVDGVACDPAQAVLWHGNTFNAGSGLYRPDGVFANMGNNAKSDWQKLNNAVVMDSQWLYGNMFGVSVMDYITDPNTKLYIGGKTQKTAEGTLIDNMRFYKEKMTDEQVKAEYEMAQADMDPEAVPAAIKTVEFDDASDIIAADGTTGKALKFTDVTATQSFTLIGGTSTGEGVLYGDINKSGQPDTDDALKILGHVAGTSIEGADLLAIADVNKSGQPDADDALAVLYHVAGTKLITDMYGGAETYQSKDKVPEKDEEGNLVYEDIDVTPVITGGAVNGKALEVKGTVNAVKYPSAAPDAKNEIQSAKTYYSGAQIANPFTASRDKLYDATRFDFAHVADTATETERFVQTVANTDWAYDEYNSTWPELRNRFSAPEAKAGVTMSFWAKVPYDEKAGAAAATNFFEFANTESLIYSSDDMAKVYIADMYAKAKEAGTVNDPDSPFFIGNEVEGTVVGVNENCAADYEAQTGAAFSQDNNKFTYLANQGAYMKWNPKAAESAAAISKGTEGQFKVYAVASISTSSKAGKKEIVVEAGRTDAAGQALYYHLKWSDTVFAEGVDGANVVKFRPTDEAPVGAARTIKGATGALYMGTTQTMYQRDNNQAFKTGVDVNPLSSTNGTIQNGQANTYAAIINPEIKETAEDEEWHYYTITITDEWMQVYIDGVACDPTKATAWNGNTFNLGSSMYCPDGIWVKNNQRSDFQKLNNDDWSGSIYGQMFGVSVMDYITDANTKLYIGGKTQTTAAGTMIDSMAFYDEVLNSEQVAAEFDARKATN